MDKKNVSIEKSIINELQECIQTLSPTELQFALTYKSKNFNATKTYLAVRPGVTVDTAKVNGCRMLKRTNVKKVVNLLSVQDVYSKSVSERDFLILQAHEDGMLARKSKQYGNSLKSIDQKARLRGLYNDVDTNADQYNIAVSQVIEQQNNVFIKPNSEDIDETIENEDDVVDI